MTFRSELTWEGMKASGLEADYHSSYEKAADDLLAMVRGGPMIYPNHIDGAPSLAQRTFEDVSPSDRDLVVGRFQRSSAEEVSCAIRSSRNTFLEWSRMDWGDRVRIFERAAELMRRDKFALAAAITLDNGKTRHEAVADVDEAIDFIDYYSEEMRRTDGFERTPGAAYPEEEVSLRLRPYGTWAVICPFNFPLAISAGMAAGALITGNTVVMKPSSDAPLPVHLFYEIMDRAGLPPGVLNVVAGSGGEAGDALVNSDAVDGIAFTGSLEVGRRLMRSSAESGRRIIAEMGSKNPVIVSGEADLEAATDGVAASAFLFSGQKCSACSRLYVHELVYGTFMAMLIERASRMTVGDPFDRETDIGPLITEQAMDNYLRWTEMAHRDGKLSLGGEPARTSGPRGLFAHPAIVESLPEEHYLMRRELFVPILCVQSYRTLQDAVVRANASEYGLTAGIFSSNETEVRYFLETIESGVVYANRRRGASTGAMVGSQSFAGWKSSGSTGMGTGSHHYLPQFMREQSRTVIRQ